MQMEEKRAAKKNFDSQFLTNLFEFYKQNKLNFAALTVSLIALVVSIVR